MPSRIVFHSILNKINVIIKLSVRGYEPIVLHYFPVTITLHVVSTKPYEQLLKYLVIYSFYIYYYIRYYHTQSSKSHWKIVVVMKNSNDFAAAAT